MPFPIADIRISVFMIRDERDFRVRVVDGVDGGMLTFSSYSGSLVASLAGSSSGTMGASSSFLNDDDDTTPDDDEVRLVLGDKWFVMVAGSTFIQIPH